MIKVIAVDDMELGLEGTVAQLKKVMPGYDVKGFSDPDEAVAYARENKISIAFLDVEMPKMSGLDLAKIMMEINPDVNIVFLTGHTDYMADAFDIFASGYLIKPPTDSAIQKQLLHLRTPLKDDDKLQVFCFNRFHVCWQGKEINFKRNWSKEILAYLIDRKGAVVYNAEIIENVLEGDPKDRTMVKNLSVYTKNLMDDLEKAGASGVLIKGFGNICVNLAKIDCDAYKLIYDEEVELPKIVEGYMVEYSWSEETNAFLMKKIREKKK